jgi:excinuclease ABC subunit B
VSDHLFVARETRNVAPATGRVKPAPASANPGTSPVHENRFQLRLPFEPTGDQPAAAVEMFISYYDYYQPEAYVPARDLFIEKDANINDELERLRHSTTRSLLTRRDVIVVASVSAIYGLGSPTEYARLNLILAPGVKMDRDAVLGRLVQQQYERNDVELAPGRFRARGDVVEVWPAYDEAPVRIELWGDVVDALRVVDPVTGDALRDLSGLTVFPAKHYVTPFETLRPAVEQIEHATCRSGWRSSGPRQAARAAAPARAHDVRRGDAALAGLLQRHRELLALPRRPLSPGEPPYTLLDYLPDDALVFLDESHVMVPQLRGMYNGDQARKRTLVDYGFRLPAALDNRPLQEDEFFERVGQVVFVSATPAARSWRSRTRSSSR